MFSQHGSSSKLSVNDGPATDRGSPCGVRGEGAMPRDADRLDRFPTNSVPVRDGGSTRAALPGYSICSRQ